MRHLVKGRNLTRTTSHKKALMKNLATALFEHKKIKTTEARAKELREIAVCLITLAAKEKDNFDEVMKRQEMYKTHEGRVQLRTLEGDTHHAPNGGCGGRE